MGLVQVDLGDRSYSIHIESGIRSRLGRVLKEKFPNCRIGVVSDETVSGHYRQTVEKIMQDAGLAYLYMTVPDGEDSKSLSCLSGLYTRLIESNFRRDDLIVALGGGVVGDLAGFLAATYLRGIRFVQVPTSLLAQVDSSVGGKVGINHALGKNLIGHFYQPQFVLIDPEVLSTLNLREIWAGMAEVIKYGFIRDADLFLQLEESLESLVNLKDLSALQQVIARCCEIKREVVSKDEKEGGLRRILNFGHTLGHALEAVTDYHMVRHGEAVIYGMMWAAWISRNRGYISEEENSRIQAVLKRFPVPDLPDNIRSEDLLDIIARDKKQSLDGLKLVLLKKIGETIIETVQNPDKEIDNWLKEMRQ